MDDNLARMVIREWKRKPVEQIIGTVVLGSMLAVLTLLCSLLA